MADSIQVTGEGIKSAEVNKKSEFLVLSQGKPLERLECHLKSFVSGTTTKCQVDQVENGYCCQYTPTTRGRHELILSAHKSKIPGSPFPVFASIHPTELVTPLREIKEVLDEKVLNMCLNSNEEMILAGSYSIKVLNKEGSKVIYSVNMKEKYNALPFGITVDSKGAIYVPCRDCLNTCSFLVKLSPKLKMVKKSAEVVGADVWNCAVYGEEVFVCNEKDTNILVFGTKDLELVRKIDLGSDHSLRKLYNVTTDDLGNLYLSAISPVHVFTGAGELLRSFGTNWSHGACVVPGGYIYMSDHGSHDILAYSATSTSGDECIASLKRQAKISFEQPWGVCADRDGFVYVCDYTNKRIVVF